MNHQRRQFLAMSLALGVSQLFSVRALADLSWALDANGNLYSGSVATLLNQLLEKYRNGQMTNEDVLRELRLRLAEIDLNSEFQDFTSESNEPILSLSKKKIKSSEMIWASKIQLFFLPAGKAHPPHGHEGMTSFQTLLQGSLQLVEFEKKAQTKKSLVVGAPHLQMLKAGQTFETTDDRNNVHWFGATSPSVILNIHLHEKSRVSSQDTSASENRIYVDPRHLHGGNSFEIPVIREEEAHILFNERLPLQILNL